MISVQDVSKKSLIETIFNTVFDSTKHFLISHCHWLMRWPCVTIKVALDERVTFRSVSNGIRECKTSRLGGGLAAIKANAIMVFPNPDSILVIVSNLKEWANRLIVFHPWESMKVWLDIDYKVFQCKKRKSDQIAISLYWPTQRNANSIL